MNRSIASCALAALCVSSQAFAAMTGWMTVSDARFYSPFTGRQAYGAAIECKEGKSAEEILLRFQSIRATQETKPFHKWQFIVSKTSDLNGNIRKIRLRDHPELKWRIIDRHDFTKSNGDKITCAILFRGSGAV